MISRPSGTNLGKTMFNFAPRSAIASTERFLSPDGWPPSKDSSRYQTLLVKHNHHPIHRWFPTMWFAQRVCPNSNGLVRRIMPWPNEISESAIFGYAAYFRGDPPKKKNVVLFMHPITSDCSTCSKKCLDFTPLLLFLVLKFPMFIWGINLPAYIYTLRYVTLRYITLLHYTTLHPITLHTLHTWHDTTWQLHLHLHLHLYLYLHLHAYIYTCMYIYIYICECVDHHVLYPPTLKFKIETI